MGIYTKIKRLPILIFLLFSIGNVGYAQMSCTLIDIPALKSAYVNPLNQTTNITISKTIRINIHFMLKTNGTGNFTETRDIYNVQNAYNGYWFANKITEQLNYWLNNNQVMAQQLPCCPIQVLPINYNYTLAGVFFERNDSYFYTKYTHSNLIQNGSDVINILVYPDGWGHGAAVLGGNICWQEGAQKAYDDYLTNGNWGIYSGISLGINHEVGHCLSLLHTKRYGYGDCCVLNLPECLDDCADTPDYQQLINNGYSDPCIWNGPGHSNNIMDYSPDETAYTPCQIEKVHNHIDYYKNYFKYGVFRLSTSLINSFTDNTTYIATKISIPSGTSISIPNGKKLFLDSHEFEVLGGFEVPLGSTFEFKPYGL